MSETELLDHVWIEVTDPQSAPDRVWMCNVHPGEQVQRKPWEPSPVATDELARLRGLLARLEWAGYNGYDDACPNPQCMATQEEGHAADCWLAKELGR